MIGFMYYGGDLTRRCLNKLIKTKADTIKKKIKNTISLVVVILLLVISFELLKLKQDYQILSDEFDVVQQLQKDRTPVIAKVKYLHQ